MSAADTVKPTPPAADQQAYEPSMEEILASIRRIIADDQGLPGREELNLRAALDPVAKPRESVADAVASEPAPPRRDMPAAIKPITRDEPAAPTKPSAAHGQIAAPQFAMPDMPTLRGVAQPKRETEAALLRFAAPAAPPKTDGRPVRETDRPQPPHDAERDQTPPSPEAVAAPMPKAAEDVALVSSGTGETLVSAFNTLAAARLIENDTALRDLARDMIRPMLKTWLDDNLPSLVERLVRIEIERVARGGR